MKLLNSTSRALGSVSARQLSMVVSRARSIFADFENVFRELESFVLDYRKRINLEVGNQADADAIPALIAQANSFRQPFEMYTEAAASALRTMSEEELSGAKDLISMSDYHKALMEATIYRRSYEKPRGYAGDAMIMDMVYRNDFSGSTPFGMMAHHYFTNFLVSSRAVRNRKLYLKRHIEEAPEAARVLTIAAGPAAEIHDYLSHNPKSTKTFLAVDHDIDTLHQFKSPDSKMSYAIGDAFALLKGRKSIAFPKYDFKGLHPTAANITYEKFLLKNNQFNLVYSAGLYDYVETFANPKRGTKALTRHLFDLVTPGGKLVVGNFSTNVPGTDQFIYFSLDWPLFYRKDEEILAFADEIDACAKIEHEPLGLHGYLVLQKNK